MANTIRWHLRPAARASIVVIVRRIVSRIVDVVTFSRIVGVVVLFVGMNIFVIRVA